MSIETTNPGSAGVSPAALRTRRRDAGAPRYIARPASNISLLSRREMLPQFGGGLAGIAFSWLLARDASATNLLNFDLLAKKPHFSPRARNIIFLYMGGGPSQMDLF